jgi:hypothetical protein
VPTVPWFGYGIPTIRSNIVELQFENQEAANNAVEYLNSALKWASGMEFGEDE